MKWACQKYRCKGHPSAKSCSPSQRRAIPSFTTNIRRRPRPARLHAVIDNLPCISRSKHVVLWVAPLVATRTFCMFIRNMNMQLARRSAPPSFSISNIWRSTKESDQTGTQPHTAPFAFETFMSTPVNKAITAPLEASPSGGIE